MVVRVLVDEGRIRKGIGLIDTPRLDRDKIIGS